MKHFFVINPAAGKGTGLEKLENEIKTASAELGCETEIYYTRFHGDAIDYVRGKCAEYGDVPVRFYACGGDGTLNEVATGAFGHENAQVASYPHGTGNDFMKGFSDTRNFSDVKSQLLGTPVKLDLISFDGKLCVNLLNAGFDCDVVFKMEEVKRKPLVTPKGAYIIGVVSTLFKMSGKHISVTCDNGFSLDGDYLLAAFGNGRFYGGGFKAAPEALLDDGCFDMCVVDTVKIPTFIKIIGTYKAGKHIVDGKSVIPFIHYNRCKKVHFSAPDGINVCFDGETARLTEFDAEVLPKAMNFSVPAGSRCIITAESGQ